MDYLQYCIFIKFIKLTITSVLNLIINGLPSIRTGLKFATDVTNFVLNLIINGLPSIPIMDKNLYEAYKEGFKPYYKWITFNTKDLVVIRHLRYSQF